MIFRASEPLCLGLPLPILNTLNSILSNDHLDHLSSPIISMRFRTTISEASFCTWFVPSQVS